MKNKTKTYLLNNENNPDFLLVIPIWFVKQNKKTIKLALKSEYIYISFEKGREEFMRTEDFLKLIQNKNNCKSEILDIEYLDSPPKIRNSKEA